jgi:hypothetical protein
MRLMNFVELIDAGGFAESPAFARIETDLRDAVDHVRWPVGGPDFAIFPEPGKKRGMGNGVTPIKNGFISLLRERGWKLEQRYSGRAESVARPGAFDAWLSLEGEGVPPFVAEWETGNISSSHRAMNKMALGLVEERLSGGVLVLPTRSLYTYLTDRIGNVNELEPYYPLWRSLNVRQGYLGVIVIEHDRESRDVPKIPKTTAGRAIG